MHCLRLAQAWRPWAHELHFKSAGRASQACGWQADNVLWYYQSKQHMHAASARRVPSCLPAPSNLLPSGASKLTCRPGWAHATASAPPQPAWDTRQQHASARTLFCRICLVHVHRGYCTSLDQPAILWYQTGLSSRVTYPGRTAAVSQLARSKAGSELCIVADDPQVVLPAT